MIAMCSQGLRATQAGPSGRAKFSYLRGEVQVSKEDKGMKKESARSLREVKALCSLNTSFFISKYCSSEFIQRNWRGDLLWDKFLFFMLNIGRMVTSKIIHFFHQKLAFQA